MFDDINTAPELEDALEALPASLQKLMQTKNMTEAELARATHIPQPTLHKILSGKTSDPRASTLKALAEYFTVSIDDLLSGVMSHPLDRSNKTQSITIISWNKCIDPTDFIKKLNPTNWTQWVVTEFLSKSAFALLSKPSMEPRFPKGTILIIDQDIAAKDGDIVVVHYPNTHEATLREFSTDGPIKLLLPITTNAISTYFEDNIKIIGVLVKTVFSFQN